MKQHPVNAAVAFFTIDGRAARHLLRHRSNDHGMCRACSQSHRVPWPCQTAVWALAAQQAIEGNAAARTQPLPVVVVREVAS